nr:PilZ domain-containing protein [Lachnospiraceae bacterium]
CDIYFYTPGGLYQCYASVADRYKEGHIFLVVMQLTSNLRKHQRREYYRLSCSLSMESRNLGEDEAIPEKPGEGQFELEPTLPLKRSIIVDISGGGIRFVSDYQYSVGDLIMVRYDLDTPTGTRRYNIVSKILASSELINRTGSYEHRAEYVNIDRDTREEIIRYIFNTERLHRKNQS